MKRLTVLMILPLLVFALEKVNLIKNSSFEKDDDTWHAWTESDEWPSVSISNKHDSGYAYSGSYSGSGDTRPDPGKTEFNYTEYAYVSHGFSNNKTLQDIDSLTFFYSVLPLDGDILKTASFDVALHFDREGTNWIRIGYVLKAPDLNVNSTPVLKRMELIDFPDDGEWHYFARNIGADIRQKYVPPISQDEQVDSLMVWDAGVYRNFWRGQKMYFDDVRLTGYADYDVGVFSILDSFEDLEESAKANSSQYLSYFASPYTPRAVIKNFGREDADEFLVIAEIEDSTGVAYIDTIPYTLTADTEDTVGFAPCTLSVGTYTLTVRTIMYAPGAIDECDEDDQMSIPLVVTGIEEPFLPHALLPQIKLDAGLNRLSWEVPGEASLTIYNSAGRKVESIAVKGSGEITLDRRMPAGVYFARLALESVTLTRKVLIVR